MEKYKDFIKEKEMEHQKNEKRQRAVVINLGCKVNKYESDAIKDKLLAAGFLIVEPEAEADIYIVNTCSVTNIAQKKSRQMLRRAKKRNSDAVVVAVGCYVNAEHEILKQEEFIDIVVGNNCKKDIIRVIEDYLQSREKKDSYIDINRTGEYEEMGSLDASHLDHQRAYIKIQDGCNQFCSYCIIPYTRGRVRSRNPRHILEEIRSLAKEGVKEFVLTGIHISSYGADFGEKCIQYDELVKTNEETGEIGTREEKKMNLEGLIKKIADVPEVKRIRLGSLEPRIITKNFLETLSKTDKVCPHFHLSLQSACDATLKRMNRKYTVEEFMEKCGMIRRYFEKPAITTDVIVGFPGETEEEFSITLENLKKLNLYEIHVFRYSVRGGTAAAGFSGQIPEEEKGRRSEILLNLTAEQKKAYEEFVKGLLDEVLIEEELTNSESSDDIVEVQMTEYEEDDMIRKDVKEDDKRIRYFTGHTKRYVKVKIAAYDNIVNRIMKVEL